MSDLEPQGSGFVVAGCSSTSNCPRIERRPDGDYAVTGRGPDGERTVIVDADLMHAAARRIAADQGGSR